MTRGTIRALMAGLAVLVLGTGAAGVARAQEVHFSVIQPENRVVRLEWNPVPGDTLTSAQRLNVPSIVFLVRSALGIPVNAFQLGTEVTGRGAANIFKGTPRVLIGSSQDLFRTANPPVPTYPSNLTISGAFQFGADYVGLGFSRPVNATQAVDPQNYSFSPPLAVSSVRLQDNRQTVIFQTAAELPKDTSYTVSVSGVTGAEGAVLTGPSSVGFQTVPVSVTNIAVVRDTSVTPLESTRTVIGQVYEPLGAVGETSTYIQDGSGRGINLDGLGDVPGLTDRGQIAVVTGKVKISSSTLQITAYNSRVLVAKQPRLAPKILDLQDATASQWSGTYIQTGAPIARAVADPTARTVVFTSSLSDTIFAGYQIWRSETPDTASFELLRTYSLLDSTWTFSVNGPRIFMDPDSIIARGTERDRERNPDLPPVSGPFNGFAYYYSITWFDAWIEPNSNPLNYTIFERQSKAQGMMSQPVYPGKSSRVEIPLLKNVKVVPNPYNPKGLAGQQVFPGAPRVQFVNLPSKASVDIYTSSGDLIRTLKHDGETDSIDWDLKNDNGKDAASGIYFFYVQASGETTTGRFVIVR